MANDPATAPRKGASSANVASLANWAGATVSLALLVGIGVWGYKLMVRDMTGIPVVEATGGPMRVAPENPGGRTAEHQGLSVNRVAGLGTAGDPADQVRLAPRAIALTEEDQPLADRLAAVSTTPRPAVLSDEGTTLAAPPPPGDTLNTSEAEPHPKPKTVQELADLLVAGAKPLGDIAPPPKVKSPLVVKVDPSTVTATTPPAASKFKGGVVASLRPKLRPGGLKTVSLAPVDLEPKPTPEVDPGTITVGTRLVQLGAFDSPETARKEWERLDTRFGEFLEGKSRVIQRASSGGRIFYRLRAMGFDDLGDARRFCSALVAGRAECIPVSHR